MHLLSQDNYPKELPIETFMKSLRVSNALFDGDLHCGYLKRTTHPASSNGDSRQNNRRCARHFVRHTLSVVLWTITDTCHTFKYVFLLYLYFYHEFYKKRNTKKLKIKIRTVYYVSVHLFILSTILWNIWYVTDQKPVAAGNGHCVTQFCSTTWTRNFICRLTYSSSSQDASKFFF
jgi:uncharacterized protein with PQ loop repeat